MANLVDLMSIDPKMLSLRPDQITDEQLATMPHAVLSIWRDRHSNDPEFNARLAPYEHQAFAREYVKENPVTGAIGLAGAIPMYQLAKMAGYQQGTAAATPPSMRQFIQGYQGIGQGLGLTK